MQSEARRDSSLIAAALVLAAILHWLLYGQGFYGISWDDAGRTLDAYAWRQHPNLRATAWLPFHRMVIGAALAIHPDLFVTPRVVTFLFGLATLAALTTLAAELFRDRRVTVATALLGAVFMPRVVLFLAPLSCGPFSCVIVVAMAALARWLRTSTRASLVLAAIAFALSTTIRYEGWAFAAAFGMVVLAGRWPERERGGWTDIALSGFIVSAFPLFWMGLGIAHSGSPFASIDGNGTAYADWLTVWRKNPLTEFVVINGLTMNLIGVWSAVGHARRDARFRRFFFVAAMPLLLVAITLLVGKRAQSGPSWRMVVVWSLLLMPFTLDAIGGLRRRMPRVGRPLAAGVFAVLCLSSMLSTYRMYQKSRWAVPPLTRDIGRDLNSWLSTYPPDSRALIESSVYAYLNLLVSSQRPESFILNSVPERDDPAAIVSTQQPLSTRELERRNIRLLVFRTRALRDILDRQAGMQRLADYGEWGIYELQPGERRAVEP